MHGLLFDEVTENVQQIPPCGQAFKIIRRSDECKKVPMVNPNIVLSFRKFEGEDLNGLKITIYHSGKIVTTGRSGDGDEDESTCGVSK